ncbi:hypothetical protein PVAND_009860 [Polypedilum vanderplanki]|uniref:Uncharacterized protein n=1 Tax=Polypedilum vanderplanki TaxID=319348 RepID=A0A9J6CFF9_POLVA|nr:hypothetical protein PVAND_009860 [Polypedilum vanderplanki]
MEKNVEKILKISEKHFEKFEKQNQDSNNFYSKCDNDKLLNKTDQIFEKNDQIFDKLEKHEIKSQNDFNKFSADQIKFLTNYESLNDQFFNFTLLVDELMEKEEQLKLMNIYLDQCDTKLKEKLTNDKLKKQTTEHFKSFNEETENL